MLNKNELITLDITDITNLGFGVGKHNGMIVFVSGAVIGDVAEVKIIKTNKSYAVGRLERLITPSPYRTDSRCPISACKSCAYKEIRHDEEARLKEETVRGAFLHEGIDARILPVVKSPSLTEYRNKAQYPISKNKNGEYVIGFFAPKSHRVTEARCCPLAPKVFSKILDEAAFFFKKYDLSVYDEESGSGLLRHIYLRRGEVSGEILFTLVINGTSLPHSEELVARLTKEFPSIVGILLNENKKDTNVVLGEKYTTLYGRDYIYDTLAGVRLKITAPSFYQVNHDAAELLYAKAKELASLKKSDTLLDLYCGAGSIGLSMADECCEIIGIEIVDSAVLCARENADAAGIKNAFFYTGDAATTERLLENAERELGRKIAPDVIILDPPRSGCDEALIAYVSALNPKRVVYVSCNPTTLARDVKRFSALGYECGEVTPFDLFPATGHVESVVCLTRHFLQ